MPLDFSSVGAVPAQPAALPAAPGSGSLDFSSVGAVPASTNTNPPAVVPPSPTKPASSSLSDNLHAIAAVPHQFAVDHPVLTDLAKGGVKSVVQGGNTVLGWLDDIAAKGSEVDNAIDSKLGITPNAAPTKLQPAAEKLEEKVAPGVTTPAKNTAQKTGMGLEQAAEFFYGEGEARAAFEALPYSEKLAKLAKATKFLEEHPSIAKAAGSGLRQAAVGTAQAGVHGADLPTALETGAVAGAGGALVEGAPGYVADERAIAATAKTPAQVLAERTAAEAAARQATAQAGVKDVVKSAGENAIERYNATRTLPPTTETIPGNPARPGADTISEGLAARRARAQVGSTAATVPDRMLAKNPIADELGSQASAVPKRLFEQGATEPTTRTVEPTFTPIDAKAAAAKMDTFGDVADTLRNTAKPDYDAMDKATGGKFNELQGELAKAYATRDSAAITETDKAIDDLLADTPGVDPSVRAGATSAWRDSKIFDKLHSAVEGSFNGISEEMAAQPGTSDRLLKSGDSAGGSLQKRIGALMSKPKTAEAVTNAIGTEGVANLYRASHLVSTPEMRKATTAIAEEVAQQFPKESPVWAGIRRYGAAAMVGEAASHATGIPRAYTVPAAEGLTAGGRWVMNKMITSPRVGQLMEFAVKNNVSPKIAGGLVASAIAGEMGANRMETPQAATPAAGGTQ